MLKIASLQTSFGSNFRFIMDVNIKLQYTDVYVGDRTFRLTSSWAIWIKFSFRILIISYLDDVFFLDLMCFL